MRILWVRSIWRASWHWPNRGRIFLLHVIPEGMVKPDLPGYQDLFADEDKALEALDKIAASRLSDCPYQVVEVTYCGDLRSRWSSAPCT